MRKVLLEPSGLSVSQLGFGCSQMMGRVGRKRSLRALAAAYDRAVTYFDVAPSYGYGEAEQLLGEFLRDKRDRVVIATKFGIDVQRPALTRRLIKTLARPVLEQFPSLRAAARRRLAGEFARGHFEVREMRQSLERSLRALSTDSIDVLLLHGCAADDLDGELLEALNLLVLSGKIRCFGLATDWSVVAAILAREPKGLSVAQMAYGLANPEASPLLPSLGISAIAHTVFGGGGPAIGTIREGLAQLQRSSETPPALREKLAVDDSLLADAALNAALRGTGVSLVLAAMYDERHVEQNVRAIEQSRFSDQELGLIRRHFCGAVSAPEGQVSRA